MSIRSKTQFVGGNYFSVTAEIKTNETGWTKFYVDDRLIRQVEGIDERILDWVLLQLPDHDDVKDHQIELFFRVNGYAETYELGKRAQS